MRILDKKRPDFCTRLLTISRYLARQKCEYPRQKGDYKVHSISVRSANHVDCRRHVIFSLHDARGATCRRKELRAIQTVTTHLHARRNEAPVNRAISFSGASQRRHGNATLITRDFSSLCSEPDDRGRDKLRTVDFVIRRSTSSTRPRYAELG